MYKNAYSLLAIIILLTVSFVPFLKSTEAIDVYTYNFRGPYDETKGTNLVNNNGVNVNCTVTVFLDYGILFGVYNVSTLAWSSIEVITKPTHFIFEAVNSDNSTTSREYWLSANELSGNYYIYLSWDAQPVIFNIRALGGAQYGTIMKIYSGANIIEQRLIDSLGQVSANLLPYSIYYIEIADYNQVAPSFIFGNIATDVSPITLTISPLSFPSDILLQYKYVHLYASRPSSNEIRVNYEDTANGTISVYYTISFINGTVAYNNTQTVDVFSDIWLNASSSVNYYLSATVVHSEFGTMYFQQVLSSSAGAVAPIDFAVFGNFAGIDTTQILGALIILIVFGVFSAFNAYIGIFAGVATSAIMLWIGWLNSVSQAAVVAAFALAILLAITTWKRRIS